MSKYPNWTQDEIVKLGLLLDAGESYESISDILGRSINGVKIAMSRKLHYKPKCVVCKKRMSSRKGNRLRCSACAEEHNKQMRSQWSKDHTELCARYKHKSRFGGNRQKALERDKFTCQICGRNHHEVVLDVHHLDKSGRNKQTHNHAMNNLITLCHSCHTKQHKEDNIMKRWAKDD